TLPTKVIICKSRKQPPLALLSPWSLDSLCSNLSGVRASDTSEADLVISVSDQGTDDQCALMISVAPSVPCVSAHQCLVPVPISSTSMPHISA
ncbi:unnamed protein product, partial [Staurois parvus]